MLTQPHVRRTTVIHNKKNHLEIQPFQRTKGNQIKSTSILNLSKSVNKSVKKPVKKPVQIAVKNLVWFLHEDKYKSGLFSGMKFLSLAHCVQQNVNFSSIYLRLKYKQGSKVHSNFLSSEISWKANNCSGGGNKILIMSSISH